MEHGDEHVDGKAEEAAVRTHRQEFQSAPEGASGPAGSKRAWLKTRDSGFGFEKQSGDVKVLMNPEIQKRATGWRRRRAERRVASTPARVASTPRRRRG